MCSSDLYSDKDPRTYPLSSYSYMILPKKIEAGLTENKGYTLAKFSYYIVCEGQQAMADLGYSPLPVNLVNAAMEQIKKIPGVVLENIVVANCRNPTFSTDGTNTLAKTAPYPPQCDKLNGPLQCSTGTGGAKQPTTVTQPTGTVGPSASASPGATADPNGIEGGGGQGPDTAGHYVDGIPTDLEADRGWRLRHTLMLIAGALLLALIAGPPLMSGVVARSAQRPRPKRDPAPAVVPSNDGGTEPRGRHTAPGDERSQP